ncbi:MAG: hypothetical protein AAGD38_00570 [Acidobacteriota bacterium]
MFRRSSLFRIVLTTSALLAASLVLAPAPTTAEEATFQPELFAPGVVSKPDRHEFGVTITADGSEVFFGVDVGEQMYEIWYVAREGDGWGKETPLLKDDVISFNDPMLDPAEKRLYFISTEPPPGTPEGTAKNADIWYVERQDDGWSDPIHAGPVINSSANDYYISFTDDGALYFASNVGSSRDGNYNLFYSPNGLTEPEEPIRLGSGVNTGAYEADPFVAPDGSYLIFAAGRRTNIGRGDIYISFLGEDGAFEKAKNVGPPINTDKHELCPFVSRDGKYFYYTNNQDIYRIDAAALWEHR